jgi:hypothetical protein
VEGGEGRELKAEIWEQNGGGKKGWEGGHVRQNDTAGRLKTRNEPRGVL